jgi:predicted O-methyltransferase YrrM
MTIRPVYDGPFCAFSNADAEAMISLVQRVLRPGFRVAEIGSWIGNGSTQAILRAISSTSGARLLCVDTFAGNPGVKRHEDIVANFDVLSTFRQNIGSYAERVDIMVADSLRAASLVANASFDLVFIDADHRYVTTAADIASWSPKVRAGGILCGHDCECRPTPEIVQMLADNPDADTLPMKAFKFAEVHVGCIVAVNEAFGGDAELMAEIGTSTIWAVRPEFIRH